MNTETLNTAAIYLRSAVCGPKDPIGLQRKLLAGEATCEGLTVVKEYADANDSGSSFPYRPQLRQLLNDAEAGLFRHLFVRDLSRLSRGPELGRLVSDLRRFGVVLHCVENRVILQCDGSLM